MAVDKKTLKFQMMMSPAEAEVLDDWMFRHRVRSRAEAIRRLCQIGMLHERAIPGIIDRILKTDTATPSKTLSDEIERHPIHPTVEISMDKLRTIFLEIINRIQFDLLAMSIETFPLHAPMPIDDALVLAAKFREKLKAMNADSAADKDEIIRMINILTGKIPIPPEEASHP